MARLRVSGVFFLLVEFVLVIRMKDGLSLLVSIVYFAMEFHFCCDCWVVIQSTGQFIEKVLSVVWNQVVGGLNCVFFRSHMKTEQWSNTRVLVRMVLISPAPFRGWIPRVPYIMYLYSSNSKVIYSPTFMVLNCAL